MAWSRKRRWTDDDLRQAIADSNSFRMVALKLGSLGSRRGAKRRARELGIDTSHFKRWDMPTRWSEQDLRIAVTESRSVAQVLQRLGLRAAGGNYDHVQRRIAEIGLDTSHFVGKAWNAGLVFRPNLPTPLHTLLVLGRTTGSHRLKLRLMREGLKPERRIAGSTSAHAEDELDRLCVGRDSNPHAFRQEFLRLPSATDFSTDAKRSDRSTRLGAHCVARDRGDDRRP
jgi:hypothetical protein